LGKPPVSASMVELVAEIDLADVQLRGEGNVLGIGKHCKLTWMEVWRSDQSWVRYALSQPLGPQQDKFARFVRWAKDMGMAEALAPPPGTAPRPVCEMHNVAMLGPFAAKNTDKPQNVDKLFFACPNRCAACRPPYNGKCCGESEGCCGKKGFLWADGSEPDSERSHQRKREYNALCQAAEAEGRQQRLEAALAAAAPPVPGPPPEPGPPPVKRLRHAGPAEDTKEDEGEEEEEEEEDDDDEWQVTDEEDEEGEDEDEDEEEDELDGGYSRRQARLKKKTAAVAREWLRDSDADAVGGVLAAHLDDDAENPV